jgi:YD repeat-containing protein
MVARAIHRRSLRRFLAISLTPIAALALTSALYANPGPLTYVYDSDHRLIAVIDGNNNAVTYQYDPVGNLLGIFTTNSTQISIFAFEPNNGAGGLFSYRLR